MRLQRTPERVEIQKPRSWLWASNLQRSRAAGYLTLAAGLHFVSVGADRVPPAHSTAKWT